MKIAFLSFYSGFVHRGVETFVHELANQLTRDNEVLVLQAGPKLPYANYQTKTIEKKIDLSLPDTSRTLKAKLFLDSQSLAIKKFSQKSIPALENFSPDVVIPTNGGWMSFSVKRFCKKTGAKLIFSGQSGPGIRGPGYDLWWDALQNPDLFVTLTNFSKQRLKKFAPWLKKIVVIPNGVDLNKYYPQTKPVKIPLPRPIILCVSALVPWKRVNLTIRAVRKMKSPASLLILGEGPEKENLQELGVSLLPGRFMITSVPHHQTPAYYTAADLFTLVSESTEAFGIVYLEALASGLPVVATDDEQRREIIGNSGLFINPADTISYANVLDKALNLDWQNKPRQRAEKFSWEAISSSYNHLFKEIT